jgi:hypothetical protein
MAALRDGRQGPLGRARKRGTRDAEARRHRVRENPWLQLQESLLHRRYASIASRSASREMARWQDAESFIEEAQVKGTRNRDEGTAVLIWRLYSRSERYIDRWNRWPTQADRS